MKKIILITLIILFGIVTYAQETSLMSFNIRYDNPHDKENWWGNRKGDVVNLIEKYHPDFLGIQEGLQHQVEYIQNHSSNYTFIGVGRDDGKTKGEYAALYYDTTKYILIKHNTFWLSETPGQVSVGWDASMERICTYGVFFHNEYKDTIYVFNTHFDHIGKVARKNSAALIIDYIKKWNISEKHVVLMGDLNCEPESKPIQLILEEFKDGFRYTTNVKHGPEGTYNGFDPKNKITHRIDYIFTKNLKINSYRHIDDKRDNLLWFSDHLPVLVKIDF